MHGARWWGRRFLVFEAWCYWCTMEGSSFLGVFGDKPGVGPNGVPGAVGVGGGVPCGVGVLLSCGVGGLRAFSFCGYRF